jgi:hypothetical protein
MPSAGRLPGVEAGEVAWTVAAQAGEQQATRLGDLGQNLILWFPVHFDSQVGLRLFYFQSSERCF